MGGCGANLRGRWAGVAPGPGTAAGGLRLPIGGVAMVQVFLRLRAIGVGSTPLPVEGRPASYRLRFHKINRGPISGARCSPEHNKSHPSFAFPLGNFHPPVRAQNT